MKTKSLSAMIVLLTGGTPAHAQSSPAVKSAIGSLPATDVAGSRLDRLGSLSSASCLFATVPSHLPGDPPPPRHEQDSSREEALLADALAQPPADRGASANEP